MRTPTDRAWNDFSRWCAGRRLSALPAHPWTVAAYARWCEPRRRTRSIQQSIEAIARMHLRHCLKSPDRHPTVVRTLKVIEARKKAKGPASALFAEKDFLETRPETSGEPKPDGGKGKTGRRAMSSRPRLVARRIPPRRK